MEKRKCLECKDLITGRSDKKFCSDQCRNLYNNRQNSDSINLVRNINNSLRKNRRVLQELNPTDKAKVHKDKMLEKGFNFNFITNIYTTKKGATYYFCYEYGYLQLDDGFYFLVINKRLKEDD
jgi:hypothetical protein